MSDLVSPQAPNTSAMIGTSISTPLVVASSRTRHRRLREPDDRDLAHMNLAYDSYGASGSPVGAKWLSPAVRPTPP